MTTQLSPPTSVHPVDCRYVAEKQAAAYLVIEGDRALFVDNNTVHAVPLLLQALAEQGMGPEQVDYAIITHVHLDHAGGTAALLAACPKAQVLAHPKAARHLIAPERLIQGAKAVYGEARFFELYGEIQAVEESRVRRIDDSEAVPWGTRTLSFFYTLGHASHHMCIHDSATNGVFTGDSFGLGLSPFSGGADRFLVCTSSPTDFDPDEAIKSVHRIVDTGADWVYLPHYGVLNDIPQAGDMVLHSLGQMVEILEAVEKQAPEDDALEEFCISRVRSALRDHLIWCGVQDMDAALHWMGSDVSINGLGLAHLARRRRRR